MAISILHLFGPEEVRWRKTTTLDGTPARGSNYAKEEKVGSWNGQVMLETSRCYISLLLICVAFYCCSAVHLLLHRSFSTVETL